MLFEFPLCSDVHFFLYNRSLGNQITNQQKKLWSCSHVLRNKSNLPISKVGAKQLLMNILISRTTKFTNDEYIKYKFRAI